MLVIDILYNCIRKIKRRGNERNILAIDDLTMRSIQPIKLRKYTIFYNIIYMFYSHCTQFVVKHTILLKNTPSCTPLQSWQMQNISFKQPLNGTAPTLLLCKSAQHRFHILRPSELPALTSLFLFS